MCMSDAMREMAERRCIATVNAFGLPLGGPCRSDDWHCAPDEIESTDPDLHRGCRHHKPLYACCDLAPHPHTCEYAAIQKNQLAMIRGENEVGATSFLYDGKDREEAGRAETYKGGDLRHWVGKAEQYGRDMLALNATIDALRAQVAERDQLICDFQAAAMIDVGGMNGPCLVTPRHIEEHVTSLRTELEAMTRRAEAAEEDMQHAEDDAERAEIACGLAKDELEEARRKLAGVVADAGRALALMSSDVDGGWERGADIILRMIGRPTLASLLEHCEPIDIRTIAAGPDRPFVAPDAK